MDMTPDRAPGERSRLLEAWAALAREAEEPNCFYAPEMLRPALQHLAGRNKVRLLEAWDGKRLIGLLPVTTSSQHGRFPVRNVTNWMHTHCFFGTPLILQGKGQQAWQQFLQGLDDASWAPGFLHLAGMDEEGPNVQSLRALCHQQGRGLRLIHCYERALLNSALSADAYWETNMRGKKRKEIRRLQNRLHELGAVSSSVLSHASDLDRWCDDFLELERAGWKGRARTALACDPMETAFFRDSMAGAFAAQSLMFLRLDLDGRPLAMLVNFVTGEGGFSFKIAFDETMARFSPGVLIEIENLRQVLDHGPCQWMDSCAAAGHPMIDSLWAERRRIVQFRVELKGRGRGLAWQMMKAADQAAAFVKRGSNQ